MLALRKGENGMSKARDIVVLVGSLRRESYNRKAAKALIAMAPEGWSFEIVEIGSLPFYSEDVEASGAPSAWTTFRERVRRADGVLFFTPEYNRSVPGVLKNAIDVASRPHGHSAWERKPAGVVSVSPGAIGGFGANHHLRQSLVFLDMPVLQQPEAYIGGAGKLFDDSGKLINDATHEFLGKYLKAYLSWVEKIAPAK